MAAAETARLIASLDLEDKMSPKLKNAVSGVSGAESVVGRLGTKFSGLASTLRGGISNALGTFTGRIKGLAQAGLGLLGVGGLFGIGSLLKSSLDKVKDFASVVSKLASITGLSAETTSALASAFDHFGVSGDKVIGIATIATQKLDALAGTPKKAAKFFREYGLSLVDTKGRLVDFNTILLRAADYFNKHGNVTERNAALAKVFGKNWREMLPFLKAGSKGIIEAEAEAKRLGLTLTKDNLDALKKSKEATRDFGTALGGLKLQIGLAFLPLITTFTKDLTGFIVTHRQDIINFFKGIAEGVRTLVDAASRIPSGLGIMDIIKGAIDMWDRIPEPMRDLIVKGVAADRTIKFLFGISPAELAIKFGQEAIVGVGKGVAESLVGAGIGKAFVQPVFVTNPGFGAGGGVPGAPVAAAPLGFVGLLAAGAGIVAVLLDAKQQLELLPKRLSMSLSGDIAGLIKSGAETPPESITGAVLTLAKNLLPPITETPQVLKDIGARDQRLGEITGGKFDILSARTSEAVDAVERARQSIVTKQEVANSRLLHATDDLEAIRAKRWTITNNLRINVPVTNRTTTYRYTTTQYSDSSSSSLAVKTSTDQLR